jgi:glucose/mannose-6-phosphate isomerase
MPHPLDRENMEVVIVNSPQQFRDGIQVGAALDWKPSGPIMNMCLAGMGGSWMAGALLGESGLLRVPLVIHRGYGLPSSAQKETLIIASSFSGNTEETLSAYDEARVRRLQIIALAAGGELERKAAEDGVPFLKIAANPPTMQPRSATGYGVGILGAFCARLGLASAETPNLLTRLAEYLDHVMPEARQRGEALGTELSSTTPIIYASDQYADVARIIKIKINENAKTPAFWNVFPELNHNELIGWTQPHGPFHALLLRDNEDHPRVLKRIEITAALLQKTGVSVTIVPIEGGSRLEKVFETLLIGDWCSYRLALELGTDPSPVGMVEELKRALKG